MSDYNVPKTFSCFLARARKETKSRIITIIYHGFFSAFSSSAIPPAVQPINGFAQVENCSLSLSPKQPSWTLIIKTEYLFYQQRLSSRANDKQNASHVVAAFFNVTMLLTLAVLVFCFVQLSSFYLPRFCCFFFLYNFHFVHFVFQVPSRWSFTMKVKSIFAAPTSLKSIAKI